MSIATIGAVAATDTDLIIPGVPQIPYALLLTGAGSTTEVIEVRSLQRGGHVYVTRGAFGSLPIAHTAPVVVTLYDPNSGGGGGGGVTVTQSATDPGAIGAGNFWLQTDPDGNFNTCQLWVRNVTDDGWQPASAGSSYSDSASLDVGFWDQASGREYAALSINAGSHAQLAFRADPADTTTARSVRVDATGIRLTAGATTVYQLVGTLDPSAGAGIAADVGSTYQRKVGTAGQFWIKTGSADTQWTKLV